MSEANDKSIYDYFKVQIPNNLIRDNTLESTCFAAYAKLVHIYQKDPQKRDVLVMNHSKFKNVIGVKSNQKLKAIFIELYDRKLIHNKIDSFPKIGNIEVKLNTFFDAKKCGKAKEDRFYFAQLPYLILSPLIINQIGHIGLRLLYYYQSYINGTKRDFCFTSYELINKETGLSENTITKYNKILVSTKMLKIVKHKLGTDYEYDRDDETGEDYLVYQRYNNHYYVQWEQILKYYNKQLKNIHNDIV